MKKWKRILAVAVMLALVFCAGRGSAVLVKSWQNGGLLGVNAVASTTENWGLGFGESGTQPTGNATPEELRKYNTYFIGNGAEQGSNLIQNLENDSIFDDTTWTGQDQQKPCHQT